MSLEQFAWTASSSSVYASYDTGILELRNDDDTSCVFLSVLPFDIGGEYARVCFTGEVAYGAPPLLLQSGVISASHEAPHRELPLNTPGVFRYVETELIETRIVLPAHSACLITALDFQFFDGEQAWESSLLDNLEGTVLVIASECPAYDGDRDRLGVVDFACSACQKHAVDVIYPRRLQSCFPISIRDMRAHSAPYQVVRSALRKKRYEKIIVMGLTPEIALILSSCSLGSAGIGIIADDESLLYRAHPSLSANYFEIGAKPTEEQQQALAAQDNTIRELAARTDITWVFAHQDQQDAAEESLDVHFARSYVVPQPVNEDACADQHEQGQQTRILAMCDFGSRAAHGADLLVRTLTTLAQELAPGQLEASVFGCGPSFDRIVEPLYAIQGVAIHNKLPNPAERKELYRTHDIALLPQRFGSSNAFARESALSGLAVLSSREVQSSAGLDGIEGIDNLDYRSYATQAAALVQDASAWSSAAQRCRSAAQTHTWLSMHEYAEQVLAAAAYQEPGSLVRTQASDPVLSIAIPSYNTQYFLWHCVSTILAQDSADKLDVIIVNDGSTDETIDIAEQLAATYNDPDHPIITIVSKENGGHGSAINAGIEAARGTYFRIIDSDDWVDPVELKKLLDVLETETSDIVITDYSQDRAVAGRVNHERPYTFMDPGVSYAFDDVCTGPYGFTTCGPIIASANFKTSMLKESPFRLSEHRYYVDMEFDVFAILHARTITYYPLDIYRYFVGRDGQSVSSSAYIRNRADHEYVITRLISVLESQDLAPAKRAYILKLINQMVHTQYIIVGTWLKDRDETRAFDNYIKAYPEIYESPAVCTQDVLDIRATFCDPDESSNATPQARAGIAAKGKRILQRLHR